MRMILALLVALIVVASCFFPWVIIESKNVSIGGFYSNTDVFGKPGIFHVALVSITILLVLIRKNWSIRAGFFVSAFNIAWALRNFVRISSCEAGICPSKQPALYVLLLSSLILPFAVIFSNKKEGNATSKL